MGLCLPEPLYRGFALLCPWTPLRDFRPEAIFASSVLCFATLATALGPCKTENSFLMVYQRFVSYSETNVASQ